MSLQDLAPLAESRQPIFDAGADSPEANMLAAFVKARQQLSLYIPAGATFDASGAQVAASTVQDSLNQRLPQIQQGLQNGADLDEQSSLQLDPISSQQFYIGKYVTACQGLGVYSSGFGRQAVLSGQLAERDYLYDIDTRLRAFSEIAHAGETGQLPYLLGNLGAVESASAGATGRPSLGPKGVLVGSEGVTVRDLSPRAGGAGWYDVSGLGQVPWSYVLIGAIAIVAGVTVAIVRYNDAQAQAATAAKMCDSAIASGNQTLAKACIDAQAAMLQNVGLANAKKGLVTDLLGTEGTKYLFYGGLLVLGVIFLPTIVSSMTGAAGAVSAARAKRRAEAL